MRNSYDDITSRIQEPPAWFDENGAPRYGEFAPKLLPDIYANEAALVEIACQNCRAVFKVAFSHSSMDDVRARMMGRSPSSLEDAVRARSLAYGDPPNAGCCPAGPTMTSDAVRVLKFWRRSAFDWQRAPELEVILDAEVAAEVGA